VVDAPLSIVCDLVGEEREGRGEAWEAVVHDGNGYIPDG
jgi:hypothetical protein